MKGSRYSVEIEYISDENKTARYLEEIEYIREARTTTRIVFLAMIGAIMLLIAMIV